MSNGRAITFIFLSSAFMMAALMIQKAWWPEPAVDNPNGDQVVQVDDQEKQPSVDDPQEEAGQPQAPNTEGTSPASAVQAPVAQDPSADQPKTVAADQGNAAKPDQEDADQTAAKPEPPKSLNEQLLALPDEFVTLGSLDKDGNDRYLVTINLKSGTIHRVELNARDEDKRYLYRDLVYGGGYLGSLNLIKGPTGLVVNAVGKDTPAASGGIQKGDVLVSCTKKGVDAVPFVETDDVDAWLKKNTKPGDSIWVNVKRQGQDRTITVGLTDKPIAIIRPEGDLVDPDFDYPESFVFSLLKPQTYFDRAWPDVDLRMRNGYWTVTEESNDQMVELKFELDDDALEFIGAAGPVTVFKRFRLPKITDENRHKVDSRSFHLGLEIEIANGGDAPVDLAYELDGPTGLTAETWWYANKIHGRQTAFGYVAGARDVVASTATNSYYFLGCPEIVSDANKANPETHYFCSPLTSDPVERQLKFIGVDSHYFNVSLLPVVEGEFLEVNSATAFPNHRMGRLPNIPKNSRLQRLVDCTFQMTLPAKVPAKDSYKQAFEIFCGPKDPEVLDDYGLSDVRTFGWFSWCSYVLLWLLHLFYWLTFETSYGLAIILLTVLARCIMIPFSRKAALNAQMMQHLAPQIKEISEKYADDMEKRAEAQRELYAKYKFNPLGGCFMTLFQLPIFYGLYKGLNVDIALRDQALIPGMSWCSNLAAPDQLLYWKDWMPGWLADETGYLGPYLNILPLATMALFMMQQKLFTPPAADEQQKMTQRVMSFAMLFLGILFFKVPAGLCIYFITSSLWGIIERTLLPKPVLDVDRFSDERKPKTAKEQKLEQAEKDAHAAEIEARKKRNAERKKKLKKKDA